jgi:5-methylcytosine-specific restriction endonuclease McrA
MDETEVRKLVREHRTPEFYNDRRWRELAHRVLKEQHYECQYCKDAGRYTKAKYVHHVNHLKDRPELAYQEWYIDEHGERQRNLVACCFNCHEAQHPERFKHEKIYLNEERW